MEKPKAVTLTLNSLLAHDRVMGLTPSVQKTLENPPMEWLKNAQAIQSGKLLSIQKNGVWYHSRRDPYREAKRVMNHPDLADKSHLIFLGAGLGYVIREALHARKFSSLLLIEPDHEMLFYALSQIEFSEKDQKTEFSVFIPAEKGKEDFESLFAYLKGKSAAELYIHPHPASLQAFPEVYMPLRKNLRSLIEKRMINQATLIKFQKIWNKNILLNLKQIQSGGHLNDLVQNLEAKTILLAGAGPSLTSHAGGMKKYRDEYLLFAVDTSYIPLLKMGLIPDVVFSSDPQWINHHYVLDGNVNRSLWVLDPAVCPAIPHWLSQKNAPMLWWDNPFYLDKFFRETSRGDVSHGGSVSTNAFDIARKAGIQNIILVGQDLSFTASKAHSKGAVLEEMVFMGVNRFQTMEAHNRKQLTALPLIKVNSRCEKGHTFTNAKLMVYIEWFENQAHKYPKASCLRFIQADPEGVQLSGFESISLEEFFSQKENKERKKEMPGLLHSMGKEREYPGLSPNPEWMRKINRLYSEIQSLKEIYAENIRLVNRCIATGQNTDIKKLEENDQKIVGRHEANRIISINAQNTILDITENRSEKDPLKASLILYSTMYKESAVFLYLLRKMVSVH